ncbi:MAG: hypothetical protein ABSF22_27030, partial [Bryobacteraceae bacterium]
MSNVRNRAAAAVLAVLFPVAVFADNSGTEALPSGTLFSLDTGSTVTSGGDMLWNGTTLAPQGKAVALDITATFGSSYSGAAGYALVTQTLLTEGAALAKSSPISGINIGDVIGFGTNGGNVAKLLVTAMSSSSITFNYTTYGTTGTAPPPTTPTITTLLNNYSYIVPGLPNYGIAPGSLFIIKGTGLASTTSVTALESSASPGIPQTLNGASITVNIGGVTTTPGMYYAEATQIAAVLPSGTPPGTGTITVSYGGASVSAPITVVASALGLDAYYDNGTGAGLGVATNPTTGALYNYTNSAQPGQTIVLWGSGLGADTADSDYIYTTTPHAVNVPVVIYIGGVQATVLYAGSSGFPGVNQINVE